MITRMGPPNLLLAGTLNAADYKAINTECEQRQNLLEAKLGSTETQHQDIELLLDKALINLSQLDTRFEVADIQSLVRYIQKS